MRDKINDALKDAVKAKDKTRVGTLRLINAAIKDRDIAGRTGGSDTVSDAEILEILSKMVKQRKEAAVTYKEAGRDELATQELQEIEVIKDFLPQQMDEEAVTQAVKEIVAEIEATRLKDMGRTMAALKEKYAGQMDFGAANKIVKELLQ